MKILIAGAGKVGSTVARQLSSEGHDLTLIDSKQEVLDRALERFDVMAVQGNCASMEILRQAGIADADLLIAATSQDEINLLCCLSAHRLNKNIHTIARIRNPDYANQIYEMRETFALSLSVNPDKQAAAEIDRLLKYPGFLKREPFARGRVEIAELKVTEESRLKGVALYQLNDLIQCRVLVCTVLRRGVAVTPDGSFVLEAGDRLFVTAATDDLARMLKSLGIATRKVHRVILCGGGRIAFYLAQRLLRSGITVQIIEQNPDTCALLANLLPAACIVHGDASNRELLESEGIDDCDALVNLTGMDEQNIVVSLFGASRDVPQIITKLSRDQSNSVLASLPIGSVICPKELCCNTIVRYVRAMQNQTGAAVSLHTIADGQTEAIEFRVKEGTQHLNEPLRDVPLKKNLLVACIIHGPQAEIPSGDSCLRAGDTVIVVTSRRNAVHQLNDIFA